MDREDMYEFITRMRKLMIEQLQVDVIEHLYHLKHFTPEEYNHISSYESRENKIICFLDKLSAKSKDAYVAFMEHQNEWYPWIVQEYTAEMSNYDNDTTRQVIDDILGKAEVPSLPLKHVSRGDEVIKLMNYLHSMKRGEYVVVHGMGGCGKSTLVIEALRESPSLVLDCFKGKIFWLMVGRESAVKWEAENEAKVKELTIQQELYTKLFTSGGYSSPPLPLDNEEGKRRLRDKLSEPDFEDCLLILDDVPSSNFVECLNIGCKILVTTDNENIMSPLKSYSSIQFLKVSEGFTERESLALFSKNLETDNKLPDQAKHIHALCKGFPLTISLVASQLADFKDDVLYNKDRWNAYVEHLKNKDIEAAIGRCDKYRQKQITSLYKALAMSINNLSNDLRKSYQDFALFMDDVNIKPEVLTTLWKKNKKEVQDIMLEFEKKCLVIRTWNAQLRSYVYTVHDLLLDYLKRKLTKNELEALHQKLIANYQEKFGKDFVDFPTDDNYIFLYLGYHLKEAGYLREFPKLYLELKFIEKKLLIHGAADVLYDFKKYKDYITDDSGENIKKYEEIYNFISRIGVCRVLSSSDIVQFALAECKTSSVYAMGRMLAKNSDKKYFEYLTEVPEDPSSPKVHFIRGEKITAAIFTSDGNVILANTKNQIKLMDIEKDETIVNFEGHEEKITHLALSPLRVFFLSFSEGSLVKIWYLNSYGGDLGKNYEKPRTPSPSLKQEAWKDGWALQRSSAEKPIQVLDKHHLPITDAQFSPDGLIVVTASKDGSIFIWKFGIMKTNSADISITQTGVREIKVREVVVSCCFTLDNKNVICATAARSSSDYSQILIYDSQSGVENLCFKADLIISSIAVVPTTTRLTKNIQLLVLGENYKALYNVSPTEWKPALMKKNLQYSTLSRRRQDECICAAVSHDGKYLALAPTFYCIIVKEIQTDVEIVKFHETNGKICGISWSYDNKSIMTTYESGLFKVWNIPKETDDKIVKLKASVFDAAWIADQEDEGDNNDNDELLITAVLDTEYNINIYHGLQLYKTISNPLTDCGDICQLCVCPINGNVIYACKDGTVGVIVFDNFNTYRVSTIPCNKVLRLKVFPNGAILLLVEKSPNKCKLVGWYDSGGSGDSASPFGSEIVYCDVEESIIDFSVDSNPLNPAVYVTKANHSYDVFDLSTGSRIDTADVYSGEIDSANNDVVENIAAKFVDFSPSFMFMASGNDFGVLVTKLTDNENICEIRDVEEKPMVCKFNFNETYFAIGFKSGLVRVHNMESKTILKFKEKSSVFDLTWSSQDNKLLVILDQEIALYDVSNDGCRLISITYLSVEKVLVNHSFSEIVTVDSGGHFLVLKHPL